MKIVGVSTSPRKGGNSDVLLDRALEGAFSAGARVEKIALSGLDFSPCLECGGCDKTGICVLHDGLEPLYKRVEDADALIVASPVFFGSLSAQAKMLIDRFQCRWVAKYILENNIPHRKKRKGVFLSVSASHRKEFFENAKSIIKNFFSTIDTEYSGELFCGGIEKIGDMEKDEISLKKAFELGKALV